MSDNFNGYNPNGGQYDPNQQAYGGQPQYDPNQQVYGGQPQYNPNQQAYGGQAYGQYDPNQQAYGGQTYNTPNVNAPKKGLDLSKLSNMNKNTIIGIAGVVVAVILVIILITAVGGRGKGSPKSVAKTLVKCIEKEKTGTHYKLYDKKYIKYVKDEGDYSTKEIKENLEDTLKDEIDYIEDYTGKIKDINIDDIDVDKEKLDKDEKDDFKDEMGYKVSQGATLEIDIEVEGKDDDEDFTIYAYAYKRGFKWYLMYWYIW